MTLEEQIKIAEKVSKFMWQEFNKKEMDMGEAMCILSAVADHTIRTCCKMCNEDYKETLKFFCDTLLKNAEFNELMNVLKK